MSWQGIVKRGTPKQGSYLGAEMFTDIGRRDGGLVYEFGAPVYDSGDVFEIVAGQEISMSAIGECFQFRRDEHGSADQPNRGSAGEYVGGGRTNGFVIPAVPETQDCLISRHHVEQGATSQPPAYGCILAAIVTQSSLLELALHRPSERTSTMTSTSRVVRTGGAPASVMRRPVTQPPMKTNRGHSDPKAATTDSNSGRLGFATLMQIVPPAIWQPSCVRGLHLRVTHQIERGSRTALHLCEPPEEPKGTKDRKRFRAVRRPR